MNSVYIKILLALSFFVIGCGHSKKLLPEPLLTPSPSVQSESQVQSSGEAEVKIWDPGLPVDELSIQQIKTLSEDEIRAIPVDQISKLSIDQMIAFSRKQILWLSVEQIHELTPAQISSRDYMDLHFFDGPQFSGLSPDVLRNFNYSRIGAIREIHLPHLTLDQIRALQEVPLAEFRGMHLWLHTYPSEDLQAMSKELLDLVFRVHSCWPRSGEFLSKLLPEQIAGLTSDFMGAVRLVHLVTLSNEQIRAFTAEQIQIMGIFEREYVMRRQNVGTEPRVGAHPMRDRLMAFLRATTHNGYVCGFPEGQNIEHRALVREHRRALLRLHPDRGAATEVAQNFNSAWDNYIAEWERLGE